MLIALKFIMYTDDLSAAIEMRNIDHHLYADDGQLSDHPSIATEPVSIHNMEVCLHDVHNWCASKRLQLNSNKTEFIWFDAADKLRKIKVLDRPVSFAISESSLTANCR